ncbi:GIY-YIG nuclease family protein [Sphingomonas bacterium]|uniref:GIY-YIG nuclease family protein n=1 Tax=Sphingomonas bacterium TaxID=1895847 RepID=UPI0015763FDE|nr:GIY-YIG nuclease family protein [Sphingomonas bacterium]
MPFRFNILLEEAGISPAEVRLLRHQPNVAGKALADVWRTDQPLFEGYQELQASAQRASFTRSYWASFISTWDGRTLFVGLYAVGSPQAVDEAIVAPVSGHTHGAGELDRFPTERTEHLAAYEGKLYIEWGGGSSGKRAWSQRADLQDKLISELHLDTIEQPFPGLMKLATPLSALADAPPTWAQALASSRGVYLLTCPRDGSLYVGSATAEGGFWSRWSEYRANGHGGNIALVDRERSDFIVSILEVAGSANSSDDILAAEAVWKRKLQSRELGLNRN